MNALDVNKTFGLLDVVSASTHLHKAGKFWVGPCPFCGGKDRFNLVQKPDGWRWLCRHCSPRYDTAISYMMRREGLPFKETLQRMGGDVIVIKPLILDAPRVQAQTVIEIGDDSWQADHWRQTDMAGDAIKSCKPARDYLTGRGFSDAMIENYLLGYEMHYDAQTKIRRPAIVLPWFDAAFTLTAIKYRFIDDLAADKRHRFTQAAGSRQILYGLHSAAGHETLIMVEGEFNAISIEQVTRNSMPGMDAISYGPQTIPNPDVLREICMAYRSVVVWADEIARAKEIAELIPTARAMCSPQIDGVKYDANKLMQDGLLADFLRGVI